MGELTQVSASATARAVRRGCAVACADNGPGVVLYVDSESAQVIFDSWDEPVWVPLCTLAIDPTDRVGRACLAWLRTSDGGATVRRVLREERISFGDWSRCLSLATAGADMRNDDVDILVRMANGIAKGGDHDAA